MDEEDIQKEQFSWKQKLNFIIPSILGVLLLMTPLQINGESTVMVSVISTALRSFIDGIVPIYILVIITIAISFGLGLIQRIWHPDFIKNSRILSDAANISTFWLFVRFIGLVLAIMVAFGEQMGLSEIIWGPDTGGLILFDLINGLFIIFLVAGFVLPLLTEFGLLEYIGVFLSRIMRPLFNLPGRSAVDCVASWVGDGTIGVTLTNKQYETGHYSAREAAVISTTFSAVSITFCLVVVQNISMMDKFGYFYLTTVLVGIICALIVPKIPPLSKKPDTYHEGFERENEEFIPDGFSKREWAMYQAVKQAEKNGDVWQYLKSALETVVGLWLGVVPTIMAIGTIVLIVSETTPLFAWLGIPFQPILELFQVPMAAEASQTMVIGFADMVVPSIMAADIPNEMTQFIIAQISIIQLIYMSETGAVILGSKLPVSFIDLFVIFLERTIVALPIVVLMAHLIF